MWQKKPFRKQNALDVNALSPLEFTEFEGLMAALPLMPTPRIAVAVSGGADSMALVILASQWVRKHQGEVTALTVDHGLRAESAAEAKQVAAWCSQHQILHHILCWNPPPLSSAVQEQARNARYQLLADWCHEHHISYLLTAHHRDDQAETLFFRLARGSGLDGLACMQPSMYLQQEVVLLRPLLPVGKARLVAYLLSIHQPWIEDPSNQNPLYTRSRIRTLLAQSSHFNDICERAYRITKTLSKFRNILEYNTVNQLTLCVLSHTEGEVWLDIEKFFSLEPAYRLRVITSLIKQVGDPTQKLRTEKLDRFYHQLCKDVELGKFQRRSFGHCIFELKRNTASKTMAIRIRPETHLHRNAS